MYICSIPLIKLQNFRKRKIHIANHHMSNNMHAFCHIHVKNLLKGPVAMSIMKNNLKNGMLL